MLLQGKVRQAVRFVTERDEGGILDRKDLDLKTGKPVSEVLKSKHTDVIIPESIDLTEFDEIPELVNLDINEDTVLSITSKLTRSAGSGGVYSLTLRHWLLRFGKQSRELRETLASLMRWLANESPPWVAYRALMSN